MSTYGLWIEIDGVTVNSWNDLPITRVESLLNGVIVADQDMIEEFLADLMIEAEAGMVVRWGDSEVGYFGYKEIQQHGL